MNVDMAKRLADRRRAAGLSQESLAEQLGVSRQAVSKWERSESSPDTDNLIALAQLYGVSLDDLLYREVKETGSDETAEPAADFTEAEEVVVEAVPIDGAAAEAETGAEFVNTEAEDADEPDSRSRRERKSKPENFHIGFDGIEIDDGKDHVHVSWREGVHVIDGKGGDEVHVGWDGVHINDKDYSSLYEAQRDFHGGRYAWGHDESTAPLTPERRKLWRTLNTFPFPLFVIIAYILLGCFQGTWLIGLELFLLIPLYYVTIALFMGHRVRAFFSTLYPLAVLGWFFYMAFVLNEPHPAWVAFLTIPLAEWLFAALAHWWHKSRKKD